MLAHQAEDRAGAEVVGVKASALLLAQGDHFDVLPRLPGLSAQQLERRDAGQDTESTVVGTPVDHRVDVRSGQYGAGGVFADETAEDVPDGITAHHEPGVAHHRGDLVLGF